MGIDAELKQTCVMKLSNQLVMINVLAKEKRNTRTWKKGK